MNFFSYFFICFLVISTILVVLCKNPVRSVLSLVLVFINVAGIFIIIGADFMSMVLVIIYVGAVVILFLFIIMMIDLNILFRLRDLSVKDGMISVFLSTFLFSNLFIVFSIIGVKDIKILDPKVITLNIHTLSNSLYSKYIIHFELFGLLLLLAMVAVVSLNASNKSSQNNDILPKKQSVYSQITRKGTAEIKKVPFRTGVKYE